MLSPKFTPGEGTLASIDESMTLATALPSSHPFDDNDVVSLSLSSSSSSSASSGRDQPSSPTKKRSPGHSNQYHHLRDSSPSKTHFCLGADSPERLDNESKRIVPEGLTLGELLGATTVASMFSPSTATTDGNPIEDSSDQKAEVSARKGPTMRKLIEAANVFSFFPRQQRQGSDTSTEGKGEEDQVGASTEERSTVESSSEDSPTDTDWDEGSLNGPEQPFADAPTNEFHMNETSTPSATEDEYEDVEYDAYDEYSESTVDGAVSADGTSTREYSTDDGSASQDFFAELMHNDDDDSVDESSDVAESATDSELEGQASSQDGNVHEHQDDNLDDSQSQHQDYPEDDSQGENQDYTEDDNQGQHQDYTEDDSQSENQDYPEDGEECMGYGYAMLDEQKSEEQDSIQDGGEVMGYGYAVLDEQKNEEQASMDYENALEAYEREYWSLYESETGTPTETEQQQEVCSCQSNHQESDKAPEEPAEDRSSSEEESQTTDSEQEGGDLFASLRLSATSDDESGDTIEEEEIRIDEGQDSVISSVPDNQPPFDQTPEQNGDDTALQTFGEHQEQDSIKEMAAVSMDDASFASVSDEDTTEDETDSLSAMSEDRSLLKEPASAMEDDAAEIDIPSTAATQNPAMATAASPVPVVEFGSRTDTNKDIGTNNSDDISTFSDDIRLQQSIENLISKLQDGAAPPSDFCFPTGNASATAGAAADHNGSKASEYEAGNESTGHDVDRNMDMGSEAVDEDTKINKDLVGYDTPTRPVKKPSKSLEVHPDKPNQKMVKNREQKAVQVSMAMEKRFLDFPLAPCAAVDDTDTISDVTEDAGFLMLAQQAMLNDEPALTMRSPTEMVQPPVTDDPKDNRVHGGSMDKTPQKDNVRVLARTPDGDTNTEPTALEDEHSFRPIASPDPVIRIVQMSLDTEKTDAIQIIKSELDAEMDAVITSSVGEVDTNVLHTPDPRAESGHPALPSRLPDEPDRVVVNAADKTRSFVPNGECHPIPHKTIEPPTKTPSKATTREMKAMPTTDVRKDHRVKERVLADTAPKAAVCPKTVEAPFRHTRKASTARKSRARKSRKQRVDKLKAYRRNLVELSQQASELFAAYDRALQKANENDVATQMRIQSRRLRIREFIEKISVVIVGLDRQNFGPIVVEPVSSAHPVGPLPTIAEGPDPNLHLEVFMRKPDEQPANMFIDDDDDDEYFATSTIGWKVEKLEEKSFVERAASFIWQGIGSAMPSLGTGKKAEKCWTQ